MFNKVKSPYNVNSVSQTIGKYILSNGEYLRAAAKMLKSQTVVLTKKIQELNLADTEVFTSKANFVFIRTADARKIYEKLIDMNIVIRCFGSDRLRITAGTDVENEAVIKAIKEICL